MREVTINRKTKETDIMITLKLDGSGKTDIDTGIGFFDHMLTAFGVHGGFDLSVKVKGDLEVDCHHTIEDTGIVLGDAFSQALGDKSGIQRYGSFTLPMDEALATCAVDISGRPFLVFQAGFQNQSCGGYDNCMTEEFFRALAFHAGITLHLTSPYGSNDHHINEALYKAAAHSIKQAVQSSGSNQPLSTKGVL